MEKCAICNEKFSRYHVKNKHGMSVSQYRKIYGTVRVDAKALPKKKPSSPGPKKKASPKKTSRKKEVKTASEIISGEKKGAVQQAIAKFSKTMEHHGRKFFSVNVLQRIEDMMLAATHEATIDTVKVVARDPAKWEMAVASVAVTSVQRLRRMATAIADIEEELFRPDRIQKARTTELAALLHLLAVQQEKCMKFLERLYGPGGDMYGGNHNTLVYVEGDTGRCPPAHLDTPEKRERAAQSVNRIMEALTAVEPPGRATGGNGR